MLSSMVTMATSPLGFPSIPPFTNPLGVLARPVTMETGAVPPAPLKQRCGPWNADPSDRPGEPEHPLNAQKEGRDSRLYCAGSSLSWVVLAALSLLGVVVFRYRWPMVEPGGVRSKGIEVGNLLTSSIVTIVTTKHDEALPVLASLPFVFFHLPNPVLTVQQALS